MALTVISTLVLLAAMIARVNESGTEVTLTAEPSGDSTFDGWSGGAAAETDDCTVTMNQAHTVIATFTLIPPTQHTLRVTKTGDGGGTVRSSPAGINCGADCSQDYNDGTVVTLTATPNSGSEFTGWSGDADCSDGRVTMDSDITCTAAFALIPPTQHSLRVTKTGTAEGQ